MPIKELYQGLHKSVDEDMKTMVKALTETSDRRIDMNSNVLVSDEIRNRNTKAVRRRNHWRIQYKELSNTIRDRKELSVNYTLIGDSVVMDALRDKARFMMEQRKLLDEELRITAYPYAEKVK